jgi:small subunit ribosomal protein S3
LGQKVNPIGLRIPVTNGWRSRWYSEKKSFGDFFHEDMHIREKVKKRLESAAVSDVFIERYANRVRVTVSTARPGVVIGRRGQDVELLREELTKSTGREVYLDIKEIKQADLDAQLVAENIAVQLVRRVSFRRAMKKAIKNTMGAGALGVKITVSGRLGGVELARTESYKEGKIPLHTLRSNINYGFVDARTKAGAVGVKVWICKKEEESNGLKGRTARATVS